ncbi:hypothetical protein RFI_26878 [Reticulomyxa filosa]|uniref:Uncharacterized protein n=1 Tax=Reticulomyxa filosa TaxID=46433 RepID=X6M927_RETFI|nr:hypothetical protein RFI_26878 [Reticulomyxa filosa]|eukprot:ETO10503.1 hypothetical protein RFI_26878 [Reticulomyxa filosa]
MQRTKKDAEAALAVTWEWKDDWKVHVDERTDKKGWQYGYGLFFFFLKEKEIIKHKNKWEKIEFTSPQTCNSRKLNHNVRRRKWKRVRVLGEESEIVKKLKMSTNNGSDEKKQAGTNEPSNDDANHSNDSNNEDDSDNDSDDNNNDKKKLTVQTNKNGKITLVQPLPMQPYNGRHSLDLADGWSESEAEEPSTNKSNSRTNRFTSPLTDEVKRTAY